jgi:hypothetical protein
MFFVVNEIERDDWKDKGYDKLQTKWQHEVVYKVYAVTESQCRKVVLMRHMNLYWLQFIVFDSLFLSLEVTKFFIIILLITVL